MQHLLSYLKITTKKIFISPPPQPYINSLNINKQQKQTTKTKNKTKKQKQTNKKTKKQKTIYFNY